MSGSTLRAPQRATASRGRDAAVALGAGLIALGLLFHAEIGAAVATWSVSSAYNHCFLVIPIVAYLLWDRQAAIRVMMPAPWPAAALAALPVALLWLTAERLGIMEGRQLAAVSFALLLCVTVLGGRFCRVIAGPLLYLYFLVPFGAFLVPQLQDVTTFFTVQGLRLLHIPFYNDGYTIDIPEGSFVIAEACAGLRFLVASVAFGCLYALLLYRSPLRRVVFIGVSLVVPVVANGLRALGIVALGHYLGSAEAAATDHVLYGWIFFSIVLLLLTALGLPFRQDGAPYRAPPAPGPAGVASGRCGSAAKRRALAGTLTGTLALLAIAATGLLAGGQLDRLAAAPLPPGSLPAPPEGSACAVRPGEPEPAQAFGQASLLTQHLVCDGVPVTLEVALFSPRVTAAPLLHTERLLSGMADAEDVETSWLTAPAPGAPVWRLVTTRQPSHVSAVALWVGGRPTDGGWGLRVRQAWASVAGGAETPLVAVVTPDRGLAAPGAARQAARVLGALVARERWLSELEGWVAAADAGG